MLICDFSHLLGEAADEGVEFEFFELFLNGGEVGVVHCGGLWVESDRRVAPNFAEFFTHVSEISACFELFGNGGADMSEIGENAVESTICTQ